MRLFDTRTRAPVALDGTRTVRIYCCGITPYDSTHLGHAFTAASVDLLVRELEYRGHAVRYVRNVTDVDDDILRKARELGEDYLELGRRELARFDHDLLALGLRPVDAAPRPTQHIPAIATAVGGLVASGSAYALDDGRVYFDTAVAGAAWGALSRLDPGERLERFRANGGDPDARGKRSATDFLLWQPSGAGEPSWPSPLPSAPPGRPGWHIECSVMAMEELGNTIDVHAGGADLVFPHHEAEILQSEHLTGQAPFARAWLHVGMVSLDGAKMSKSLGNLVFVRDLLERYEAGAIRRYLLEHHYRVDWSYSDNGLADAAAGWKAWRKAADSPGTAPELELAFHAALADDLDSPRAVELLDEVALAGAGVSLRRMARALGLPDLASGAA